MGQHPQMGFEQRILSQNESANDFASWIKKVHAETMTALQKAAENMKRYTDKKWSDAPEY
jgi:hypothetical protein